MVQKSPAGSRGVSPARRNVANGNLTKQNKNGAARRSQSLTRNKDNSSNKNNNNSSNHMNGNRSRGVSPAKSNKSRTPPAQPVMVRSRGSE